MDIGLLISANLPLSIAVFIIVVTMAEVNLGFKIPDTLPLKIVELIILVTMVEMDPGLKIPATLPLEISEQELMLMGEVDICITPSNLTPTIQVAVVDC